MTQISNITNDIIQILSNNNSKPIISYYPGVENIKKIYLDTLNTPTNEYIYSILNPETVDKLLYEWLTTEYVKQRVERKIFAHVFISNNNKSLNTQEYLTKDKEELRETHCVDSFGFEFESEIQIYGTKVALVNYNPKEEILGIIIDHPVIQRTLKAFYLHYLWKMV